MSALLLSVVEASPLLQTRQIGAEALLEESLLAIESARSLNAFASLDLAGARERAKESEKRLASKTARSVLEGIPLALKDNLVTAGAATGACSRMLAGYRPPYDGAASARLKAAGAVVLGKTNMDEFAMGSSTEHSVHGPVLNPWSPDCVAGGTSGGSAAAVAANLVFGAFGTDTGGSIRQPASFCGVFGLKPTYGRVSRHGVIAHASSLDQVGPLARSVEDLAILLGAVSGFDPLDSTSSKEVVPDYRQLVTANSGPDLRGMKVGLPKEYFVGGIDPEVESIVRASVEKLKGAGAEIVELSLPHTRYALSTYYLISTAEASSNLARYDGLRYGRSTEDRDLRRTMVRARHEGFGSEVKRRIMLGTFVLSAGYFDAYYGKAQRVRTLIRRDFEAAFASVDLLATPVSPFPAFRLGEKIRDPLSMYLADVFTLAVSLAGVPGLSVPAGITASGLPVGVQLIGPWFAEGRLLSAGAAICRHAPQTPRKPEAAALAY